jgi:hypothetical protein
LSAIAFRNERRISVESITLAVIAAMTLAWFGCNHFVTEGQPPFSNAAVKTVVERIIAIESNGDSNARNKRSSATGVGQFLEETWLEMIGTYRPDLVQGRSDKEILELRRDPELAREIVARLVEQNAAILKKRALPVTPGTLYLAHFTGPAGAVAVLSVSENADAAALMASAEASGRTTREKLVNANPFLRAHGRRSEKLGQSEDEQLFKRIIRRIVFGQPHRDAMPLKAAALEAEMLAGA